MIYSPHLTTDFKTDHLMLHNFSCFSLDFSFSLLQGAAFVIEAVCEELEVCGDDKDIPKSCHDIPVLMIITITIMITIII